MKEPVSMFDPIGQTDSTLFPDEPWMDPMAFFSDQSYFIRAVHDNSSEIVPIGSVQTRNAAFIGGYDELVSYLKENILEEIAPGIGWLKPPTLTFTVNEHGETEDVELVETSGNADLDGVLLQLITDMPSWEPAIDAKGSSMKQAFEFKVVQGGC